VQPPGLIGRQQLSPRGAGRDAPGKWGGKYVFDGGKARSISKERKRHIQKSGGNPAREKKGASRSTHGQRQGTRILRRARTKRTSGRVPAGVFFLFRSAAGSGGAKEWGIARRGERRGIARNSIGPYVAARVVCVMERTTHTPRGREKYMKATESAWTRREGRGGL